MTIDGCQNAPEPARGEPYWHKSCRFVAMAMIRFITIPLKHEGILEDNIFRVPDSPSTEDVLNTHAKLWKGKRFGSMDPELELYNFVADRWPFINLASRLNYRRQLPLTFSLP
jgi:hypothetical protein